jgi:hypothetical protein
MIWSFGNATNRLSLPVPTFPDSEDSTPRTKAVVLELPNSPFLACKFGILKAHLIDRTHHVWHFSTKQTPD